MNLSLDNDDLTEMSLDDSEDDTEEEEFDSEDLFSQEIFPNIFTQLDFEIDKPLLIQSKELYSCSYYKILSPPPELTV
ncbi:MAG: hypothetical protein RI883_822 [Bacteroidota bacterium]|jgi:hypothetical protein